MSYRHLSKFFAAFGICAILGSAGCTSSGGDEPAAMSSMRGEEVATLPTVLEHTQPDGSTVLESVGVRSFGATSLESMNEVALLGVKVRDNGDLMEIIVRESPDFPLEDGTYYAREAHVSAEGMLVGVVEADSEARPDCEVTYVVIGDTIHVLCRDNSCPEFCRLEKEVGTGYIAYRCVCPTPI